MYLSGKWMFSGNQIKGLVEMNQQSISDYSQEMICIYKEETYSVRDNGAIFRHPRKEGRIRVLDAVWTFGKVNSQKGYLEIGNIAIHRIVAIAFLGPPPTAQHVVDHIDTNRQNNRPENLRWVTRFENIILNEITRKKIELLCGCSSKPFHKSVSIVKYAVDKQATATLMPVSCRRQFIDFSD